MCCAKTTIRGNCNITYEEKTEFLKKGGNILDLIAEKSGLFLLLPIGADHLGIPTDIQDQIAAVNEILKEDYQIRLGSPFDYFKNVGANFDKFKFDDELRDNSKTFTLQGCYSSRLDLKRYNVECSHRLDLASRFVRFQKAEDKYNNVLEYAYKLLVQNQAHDSICGCSTDDVHSENITRYKRILQIANTIIDEIKFENKVEKALLRNAMRDYLPEKVLWRKKSPYPKTHNPKYMENVLKMFEERYKKSRYLRENLDKAMLDRVISSGGTWFGQLMDTPQLLAWLLQLDFFIDYYNINIVD